MTDEGASADFADFIARLRELADEDGGVTVAQVDEALGPLDFDVEFLWSEIKRSGLHWKNEYAGPPDIPSDYPWTADRRKRPRMNAWSACVRAPACVTIAHGQVAARRNR